MAVHQSTRAVRSSSKVLAAILLIMVLAGCPSAKYQKLMQEAYWAERAGAYDRAEQKTKEAYDHVAATLGTDHPRIALPANNLAMIRLRQGQIDEAQKLLENALRVRVKTHGDDDLETGYLYDRVGIIWAKKGDIPKALANMRNAQKIIANVQSDHRSLRANARRIGMVEQASGNFDKARKEFEYAKNIFFPGCPAQRTFDLDIAGLYLAKKEWVRARRELRRLLIDQLIDHADAPLADKTAPFVVILGWFNTSKPRRSLQNIVCQGEHRKNFDRTVRGIIRILDVEGKFDEKDAVLKEWRKFNSNSL